MRESWLHTGGMAHVDDDGYLFIVDRKKDMIIRRGYNVYPREIEEVLYGHRAVLEPAVVAVPDQKLGEEVGAAVVLRPEAETSADEIRASSRGGWRRTSTGDVCGSRRSCRKGRRARSSSERLRYLKPWRARGGAGATPARGHEEPA